MNPFPEKLSISAGSRGKKNQTGLKPDISVFKWFYVNQSDVVLLRKVLDFLDKRLSLYTESYLVTVAIVSCSDNCSWHSATCGMSFRHYLK